MARVEPSHFDAGTCYVVFDGHRTDDHKPYVFVTKDYGATWTSIAANLPAGNVNVIREDPKNRNLLYLGTEYALFISLNGGKEWKRFMTGLPTVRIDDILVHPRDNDLIIGTHGRSIWILDDITRAAADDRRRRRRPTSRCSRRGRRWRGATTSRRAITVGGNKHFRGENPAPGTAISYYLKSAPAGDVKITISDVTGTRRPRDGRHEGRRAEPRPVEPARQPVQGGAGGRGAGGGQAGGGGGRGGLGGGPAVEPGTYLLKLTVGGKDYTQKVVVEADSTRAVGTEQ